MCNHYILATGCPQALGSLRFHLPKPATPALQRLKILLSLNGLWAHHPLAAPMQLQERVWKSFPTAQISMSNPYKSSSCCRGQLQAQLLGRTGINASCWEGGSACEQPRGELLQGSVGPAGFDSSAREAAAWKLRAGTIHTNITHGHAAPRIKATGESSSSLW